MESFDENLGARSLALGSLRIDGTALLAPMAGVTDFGMRRIARRFGASLVISEMIASDEYLGGRQEARLRAEGAGLHPHVVQIAGCDADLMARAAQLVEASGADVIDINMGCPSKRVNGRLSGSALMRDLNHAARLIAAVVKAVKIPVTVKMRLGWDAASINAPELARRAQAEGAQMVTVHGRTRAQFYTGTADWAAIRAVRARISIPLVANGDCMTLADARAMLAASGADAVMVGRAALGRPWLVGALARGLAGAPANPPPPAVRCAAAHEHLDSLVAAMGPVAGLRHARKHLAAYAREASGGERQVPRQDWRRDRLVTTEDVCEAKRLLQSLFLDPPIIRAA